MILVRDVLNMLNHISKGKLVNSYEDFKFSKDSYAVEKSSVIDDESAEEMSGLIYGDPMMEVKKIAVVMTLTESAIELAAFTHVNVIIVHHPINEGDRQGSISYKNYLSLYNIAVFELHEAFHGLHPGIPWLHGYNVVNSFFNYRGITGNTAYIGRTFDNINTLGDILKRLEKFMDVRNENSPINEDIESDECRNLCYVSTDIGDKILNGNINSPVKNLLHIFPHTGFNDEDLEKVFIEFPYIDTVLVSISHIYEGNPLLDKSRELGLNFICGNSRTMEVYENGLPISYALKKYMPHVEVVIFRESTTSIPLESISTKGLKEYGEYIASKYL